MGSILGSRTPTSRPISVGGAIMRRKPAALHNIGIDRDARALDGFKCDYPVELIHGCAHRFLSEYAFVGSELIYSDPPYGAASWPLRTRMRRTRKRTPPARGR